MIIAAQAENTIFWYSLSGIEKEAFSDLHRGKNQKKAYMLTAALFNGQQLSESPV